MPMTRLGCFVIMPFNRKDGAIRAAEGQALDQQITIDFDKVYDGIIEPAIRRMNWEPVRADKIIGSGDAFRDMFGELLYCPFAIVDTSFWNANVFYELGARHAIRKSTTIAIRHVGTPIPHDIISMPHQFDYRVDAQGQPTDPEGDADRLAAHLRERAAESGSDSPVLNHVANLSAPSVLKPNGAGVLHSLKTVRFQVKGRPDMEIGIKTGDLKHIKEVDAWVNSENTHMLMARPVEQSVSATIRYLGAQKRADGGITRDDIQNRLIKELNGQTKVALGTVLETPPGALWRSHGVKRVFHVATVQSEYLAQVVPGDEIDDYAKKAILAADKYNRKSHIRRSSKLTSILLPVFGSGQGRLDLESAAEHMVSGAIAAIDEISKQNAPTRLKHIYLLAFTRRHLDALDWSLRKRLWSKDRNPHGVLEAREGPETAAIT